MPSRTERPPFPPKGRHVRLFAGGAQANDDASQVVRMSASSEEPALMPWGYEVLSHAPGAVDLSWIASGRAALLVEHEAGRHIGVVEAASLDADRKLRVAVRFSASAAGAEARRDVLDGIKPNVSIGYEILATQRTGERNGEPVWTVTKWRPLEISLVAIPADVTVGVGRSAPRVKPAPLNNKRRSAAVSETLDDDIDDLPSTDPAQMERARVSSILVLGRRHGRADLAERAISSGMPIERFRGELLNSIATRPIDLSVADDPALHRDVTQRYSLVRAIRAASDPKFRDAGFEIEVSAELERRTGKRAGAGLLVPTDLPLGGRANRALTYGGTGNAAVQTNVLMENFIDVLRAQSSVMQLGATELPGLSGNVAIPRLAQGATGYWFSGDHGDQITESTPTLDQVALAPKAVGGLVVLSHRMLVQTSGGIEDLIRRDLATMLGTAVDRAAIQGSGTGSEPRGILNTTGVHSATFGSGGAPSWSQIVAMETALADVPIGRRGYLASPTMKGRLKTTGAEPGTPVYLWPDYVDQHGASLLNTFPAFDSSNVPAQAVIFGEWTDLLIGTWGVLSIEADPYGANFAKGSVAVRALMDADIAVRHAGSFAKLTAA